MSDSEKKDILQAQRDVALNVAANQAIRTEQVKSERDSAMGAAAFASIGRDAALIDRNRVAADRDRVAGERNAAINQRDAAQQYAAVEREEANSSATGFYLLLGVVAIALVIIAGIYLSKGKNLQPDSITVTRVTPITPPLASPAPVVLNGTNTTPAPAPPPVAAAPAPPSTTFVPVPVPTPVATPAPAPAPATTVVVTPPPAAPADNSSSSTSRTDSTAPDGSSSTTTTTTTTAPTTP